MTPTKAAAQPATRTVRWHVPALIERPAVGTTCCASTAEGIVAQELSMLPGVVDISVDPPSGVLVVVYEPAQTSAADLAAALGEVGYPPVVRPGARGRDGDCAAPVGEAGYPPAPGPCLEGGA